MLLFNRSIKYLFVALTGLIVLAGCTFSPVYDADGSNNYAIGFGKPASVVEQTIVQELAFKLGRATTPAYMVNLSTSTATRSIYGVGSQFVRTEYEATVSTSFKLIDTLTDEQVASGQRFASAIYQSSTQNVANNAALSDAYQRAAKDVAGQIELLIVAALKENKP